MFEKEHRLATDYDAIDVEVRDAILQRIRERESRVEQFVIHDMLTEKLSEARRTPRRYMRVQLIVLVLFFVVLGIILAVFQLLHIPVSRQ